MNVPIIFSLLLNFAVWTILFLVSKFYSDGTKGDKHNTQFSFAMMLINLSAIIFSYLKSTL